ncbi:unnamed protein product [Calypogeia fissa]
MEDDQRQMVSGYITDLDTKISKLEIELNDFLSQMEANNFTADRVGAFKGLQEQIKKLVHERENLLVRKAVLDNELEHDRRKLTWDSWLREPLRYPDLVYEAGSGSRKRHTGFSPQDVKSWVEFQSEVNDYVSTFESGPRFSGDFRDLPKYTESTHAAIRHRFALVLGAFLSYEPFKDFTIQLSKPTRASGEEGASRVGEPSAPASEEPVAERALREIAKSDRKFPDISVANEEGKVFLVVECKRPGDFRSGPHHAVPDLVSTDNRVMRDSIRQVTKYIVSKRVSKRTSYAVLTSEDISYFLKVDGDTLYISDGVMRQPTYNLLCAISYIFHTARDKTGVCFKNYGNKVRVHGEQTREQTRYKTRSTKRQKESEAGSSKQGGGVDSHNLDPGLQLREVNVLDLNICGHINATGTSGNLGMGQIGGQQVVLKVAPVDSDRAKMLLHEATIYLSLRELWGSSVPRLIDYGLTVRGTLVFLAIEYLEGLTLEPAILSEEIAMAVFQALMAIHSCGVLHGDLHEGNILVLLNGDVRIIDFGFAEYSSSSARQDRELHQLKNILQTRAAEV